MVRAKNQLCPLGSSREREDEMHFQRIKPDLGTNSSSQLQVTNFVFSAPFSNWR